jgi:transcription elongation factor Elf1
MTYDHYVFCPFCGAQNTIRMNASEIDYLTCSNCDTSFLADDPNVLAIVGKDPEWQKFLTWIKHNPGMMP